VLQDRKAKRAGRAQQSAALEVLTRNLSKSRREACSVSNAREIRVCPSNMERC